MRRRVVRRSRKTLNVLNICRHAYTPLSVLLYSNLRVRKIPVHWRLDVCGIVITIYSSTALCRAYRPCRWSWPNPVDRYRSQVGRTICTRLILIRFSVDLCDVRPVRVGLLSSRRECVIVMKISTIRTITVIDRFVYAQRGSSKPFEDFQQTVCLLRVRGDNLFRISTRYRQIRLISNNLRLARSGECSLFNRTFYYTRLCVIIHAGIPTDVGEYEFELLLCSVTFHLLYCWHIYYVSVNTEMLL